MYTLKPGLRLGFLGSGQLARMSAQQAFRFGIEVGAFAREAPDPEPLEQMTPYATHGGFDDMEKLDEFCRQCDVVTLENEFIDSQILYRVADRTGVPVYPSPDSFAGIETKLLEKKTFADAGIPVTPYAAVDTADDIHRFAGQHGWPLLLKSSKGGYDGYGNQTVREAGQADEAFRALKGDQGHQLIAEAFVDYRMELAVQVASNERDMKVYPCCQTIQEDHICKAVLAPAPISPELQKQAREMAVEATRAIDGQGVFAYEFFLTGYDQLLLNEAAPRPHNSGHYTIEGCIGSQFENHVRAVLNLPMTETTMRAPAAVMINVLGTRDGPARPEHVARALSTQDGHLHLYGKTRSRKGRKMGHYTLLGDQVHELYETAQSITKSIEL